MVSIPVLCPDAKALTKYLLGQTPEQAARDLEEHVAVCSSCALKLNELTDRDTLAQPLPHGVIHVEEASDDVEALISRLCDRADTVAGAASVPITDVLGDFRIVREIGRGGMGVVYMAEQISLGRKVALKVLPFAAALDQKQLQRFKNEAQAAAQLHHTNIVPVHYVGCERGVHFYAMQFIEGQSLAGVLDELRQLAGRQKDEKKSTLSQVAQDMLVGRSPPAKSLVPEPATSPTSPAHEAKDKGDPRVIVETPPPGRISSHQSFPRPAYFRTVARLGVQAAEALEHAHQMGVVHRDIKPANLLVDVRANLWITDFGLAHCQHDAGLTMTGDLLGTLRYMSPEQALANRVVIDHRTDIYSLGASLYEMLTLEPVFAGSDRRELLRQIAFEEPRPPRRLTRAVPAELETIVLKALEKNPLDRYSTARELADDLQRVLDDQPIRAKRPTLPHRARKWARRHEGVVATVTVALLTAVLILTVSTWLIIGNLNRAREAEKDASTKLVRALRAEEEAKNNLEKAKQTEHEKGKARLAQAEAGRWSGRAGRVFDSLQALAEAAQIARSVHAPAEHMLLLRNEAIACMALPDLRPIKEWEKYTPDTPGAALDPRSERYTTSDAQGNISIRRMADDREILHLNGPGMGVESVAFSPDGEFLQATYTPDAQCKRSLIRIWDLRRGEIAFRLTPDFPGPVLVWSPDSRRFAVHGQARTILLYDVDSRKEIKRISAGVTPYQIAFHPHGQQLAFLRARAVQIRDVETGNLVSQFVFPVPVERLAWGGDGRFLAGSPSPEYWDVYLWDVPAGEMKVLKGHVNTIIDVAFNHAGDLLASTSWDNSVRLWNPWTGKEVVRTEGYWGRPIEFSPDDRFLSIAVGWSKARRWCQVKTGREHRTLYSPVATTVGLTYVEFSPSGRLLATAANNGLRLWDVAAGRHIAFVPGKSTFRFEPHGKSFLAAGPWGLHRWPLALEPDELRRKVRMGPPEKLAAGVISLEDVSRDGQTLLALEAGRRLTLLPLKNPSAGRVLTTDVVGFSGGRLSADGQWIAAGSWHGSGAKVWDAQSGKLARQLTTKDAGICFSPDGKWLVTSEKFPNNWEYQLWHVGSWKTGPKVAVEQTILGAWGFSPDGNLLAIVDSTTSAQLRDTRSGRRVATLTSPEPHWGQALNFSPDGSQLALGSSSSSTIYLWDLRAIRGQLAAMGLDWDLPAYPQASLSERPETGRGIEPLQVQMDLGELKDTPIYKVTIAFQCQVEERLYARAARLYTEGFAAEPELANDLRAGHRYNAACAAALAGCAQGQDAAKLDDAERARLRRQALDWLRADLTAWGRFLEKAPEKAGDTVERTLRHWHQDDPDLAGVRGDALAKLPEAERASWRQLWRDVEQTLGKATRKDTKETERR
jgi:eukaryotic-like serine/threonine-protein kinase